MTALTPTQAPDSGGNALTVLGGRLAAAQRKAPVLQIVVLAALVLFVGQQDGDFAWNDLFAPILLQASFLGIAAAGQTLVILIGGLDFSIAAYIVVGNLLVTHLAGNEHWNFAVVAALVAGICLAGGAFSGWICHRFKLEPLVITLAMSSLVIGALVGTNTNLLNGSAPKWLQSATNQTSKTFGLPLPPIIVVWIVLAALITLVLLRTAPGRRLYLTGAGPRAADLAGVRTRRVWTAAYASSALLAGIAGVLLAGYSPGGDSTVGNGYLFPGLAAVIVGGTMMGGRGDYLRTCLGALIVTALNFVIVVLNLDSASQSIVFGVLILLAVALYGRERRLRDRV
jgi:ribose transport system permease protein